MKRIPEHGKCFVCGTANPNSMGLVWYSDGETISSEFTFDDRHQGPPGHVHGGASAAVLDEAMGAAVWRAGLQVVAARLEIDYKRPLPLGQKVSIRARIEQQEGKKVFALGEIVLADGTLAVSGRGIFVTAPHLFENVVFLDQNGN